MSNDSSSQQAALVAADLVFSIPAGTRAGTALRDTELPTKGVNAILGVQEDDGTIHDLGWVAEADTTVTAIPANTEDGRTIIRHSAAHVMAQAVQQLFPDVKFGIGPAIENGFYYDFRVAEPFTPDDLKAIEKAMRKIVKQGQQFRKRSFASLAEAEELSLIHI